MSASHKVLSVGGLAILVALVLWPRCILRPRFASQESSAISRLRMIAERETADRAAHAEGFADSLSSLGFRDRERGYAFSMQVITRDASGRVTAYIVTAAPAAPGRTGTRYFSLDQNGILAYDTYRLVDERNPLLQ